MVVIVVAANILILCSNVCLVFFYVCKHITENWGITDVSDRENVVIYIIDEEGDFICKLGHIRLMFIFL